MRLISGCHVGKLLGVVALLLVSTVRYCATFVKPASRTKSTCHPRVSLMLSRIRLSGVKTELEAVIFLKQSSW